MEKVGLTCHPLSHYLLAHMVQLAHHSAPLCLALLVFDLLTSIQHQFLLFDLCSSLPISALRFFLFICHSLSLSAHFILIEVMNQIYLTTLQDSTDHMHYFWSIFIFLVPILIKSEFDCIISFSLCPEL